MGMAAPSIRHWEVPPQMTSTNDRTCCTTTLLFTGPRGATIALAGEIDVTTEPTLAAELEAVLAEHGGRLALDLTDLSFMDSCGVRLIADLGQEARRRGGELRVVGATGQV